MKRIVVTLFMTVLCCGAFAQGTKVDTLYLSDIYTTHIHYATEVIYFDISSPEDVVAKILPQNKNYFAIKANRPFNGYYSVTTIEANESIHTYIVGYMQSPSKLVIEEKKNTTATIDVSGNSYNTMAAVEKAAATGNLPGFSSQGFSLSTALSEPKSIYHLSDKAYDISASCDNIIIYRDMIYFVLSISNKSGMAYNCPDASFVIEPLHTTKRTPSDERPIYHKGVSGSLSCAPGQSSKAVYCFDVFTVLKDKCLKIFIDEINGQRELCIIVNSKDVNKARIW